MKAFNTNYYRCTFPAAQLLFFIGIYFCSTSSLHTTIILWHKRLALSKLLPVAATRSGFLWPLYYYYLCFGHLLFYSEAPSAINLSTRCVCSTPLILSHFFSFDVEKREKSFIRRSFLAWIKTIPFKRSKFFQYTPFEIVLMLS